MKKFLIALFLLLVSVCLVSCDGAKETPPVTTVEEHTVTFIWQGGSKSEQVANGVLPTAPSVEDYMTVKSVYTFTGWDKEISPVSGDATYTALYSSTPRKYTVTFEWENQSQSFELAYGAMPTSPIGYISYSDGFDMYYRTWAPTIGPVYGDVTYTAVYISETEELTASAGMLDMSLRTFKIQMSDRSDGQYQTKCEEYMQGPDSLSDTSSTIERLVYERNRAAREHLGTTVEYVYTNEAWGSQAATIKAQTDDAASSDAADMFVYAMSDMVAACFNSSFRDLASIDGSYLRFYRGGWYESVMEDLSFGHDKIYLMVSDYFPETYRSLMALPINLTLLDSARTELSPILLPEGQSLTPYDKLSEYLYTLVNNGEWTWDTLTAICEAIYLDNNNDSKEDSGDRMGIYMDAYGGIMATAALYSTRLECLTNEIGAPEGSKDADKLEGKLVPTYPETGDAINRVFLAIGRLMSANGSYSFSSNNASASAWFKAGLGLTPGLVRLGELEADDYRTITDTFTALPIPLLSEDDRYNTLMSNTAAIGGFNINSTKYLAMSAYVQFSTVKSYEVKGTYLTDLLRFEEGNFSAGMAEMLDLICSNVHTLREMILDDVLYARKGETLFGPASLGDVRWNALIKADGWTMAVGAKDGAFLDKYDSLRELKQKGMDELMAEWYALETAPAQ